jgi:hypothetical protein
VLASEKKKIIAYAVYARLLQLAKVPCINEIFPSKKFLKELASAIKYKQYS